MKKAAAPAKTPAPPAKTTAPTTVSKSGQFDPKHYAKNGLTVEDIEGLKKSFDLFDTDGGGAISMKGRRPL